MTYLLSKVKYLKLQSFQSFYFLLEQENDFIIFKIKIKIKIKV